MKRYIIILLASLMAVAVNAQDYETNSVDFTPVATTPQQERQCYQKALELMHDYVQSAAVSDETEEFNFRKLFTDEDMQIANDLMSLSREDSLYLNDYVTTLQKAKRVKVVVRNIRKEGQLESTNAAWILRIAFEKGISYSRCGTLFNSVDYFGDYYHLIAELAIDKMSGACKIRSLIADDGQKALVFPEQFTVLERTHEDENRRNYKRDDKLTINGKDVSGMWNLYGQVILHDGDKIKYNNASIDEEVITEDACGGRKIHANYNDKAFRLRANMGYSLFGFNKVNNPDGLEAKDSEMSFGLDFGYVLPSTSKFYVGFFAGIGMSKNDLTLEQKASEARINSPASADEDGDTYTRNYKYEGITQKLKAMDITVPIYADLEWQFIPQLSAYANLGMRLQTSSDKWEAEIGKYTTSGTYNNSAYGDDALTIENPDGSINLNGFGSHKGREMDVDKEGMTSSLTINALVGAGLRANIGKSFAIDAGVQFLIGGKSWKIDENNKNIFSYTLPNGWEAMDAEQKAQGDKVNLLRLTDGIKHNPFRVTLGIIYKF